MGRVKKLGLCLTFQDIRGPICCSIRSYSQSPEEVESWRYRWSLISSLKDNTKEFLIDHRCQVPVIPYCKTGPQNANCCLIKLITWDLILSSTYISKASTSSQAAFLISSWTHFGPSFLCDFASFVHSPGYVGSLQPHPTQHLTDQNKSCVFWDCLGSKDSSSQTLVGTRIMYRDCKYADPLALNLEILIQQVLDGA